VTPDTKSDDFRDHIATADQKGRRLWVYPTKPKGRLTTARSIVAFFLLLLLFAAPFIEINGEPSILLDILERNFVFFGLVFRPQDIFLFVLVLLTLLVFVVLFTAIFGRLFCGWICPQTVFMEMVFRRIEYWIDGSPHKQRKLREGPWNEKKILKWILKQSIFFGLSFVICNVFLAYVIGIDELRRIVTDPPSEHLGGLTAMMIFTFLFYGVFSWFREQACTLVCPYGRLQGVLIDPNSIVVAYDHVRGEPRARMKRNEDRSGKGDCVVCKACVAVCPTGIDIRNGTQLECVNCTACIDACNSVMRKVKLSEGLIRYTSENRLEGVGGSRLSGRIIVYSLALAVLVALFSFLMITRTDVQTTILRTPGTLYYETDSTIRNLYSVKLINKTFDEIDLEFRLKAPIGGSISMVSGDVTVEPEGFVETALFVDIPRAQVYGPSTMVLIEIVRDGDVIDEIKTNFVGPGSGGSR
jgi:cytochrome c oxidase accessory protein FixG